MKLISILEKESDRLYDITYDSLMIDIYNGNVEVKNFSIVPCQVILDSLYQNNIPRKYIIDF